MSRPKIILDCDPGHDDAIAIVAAARHADLLGITTVSGNVDLDRTTRNALTTVQLLGLSVPVHAGAHRPLVAEPRHAQFIHGESGLEGPRLPRLERSAHPTDAVSFIVETVRSQEDVWLVAVGPLTNVALALRSAPDIAGRLRGISMMGGGLRFGNVTPAAEFNILADPEAAHIVFEAPVRRLLAPLDLTHQFLVDDAAIRRIRALSTPISTFVADLLEYYVSAYERAFGLRSGPLHDPCSLLAVTHPRLFERRELNVAVELRGELTRGMTVADQRGVRSELVANTEVLTSIDDDEAFEVLLQSFR